jgi:osomolarity two-component system, sensor histidine kinase TcsA
MTSRKRSAEAHPDATVRASGKSCLSISLSTSPTLVGEPSPPASPPVDCLCQRLDGMDRIFLLSPSPNIVLDKDLRILVVSTSWSKFTNIDLKSSRGRTFTESVDVLQLPINPVLSTALIDQAVATRKEQKSESLPGREPDTYWCTKALPVYDDDELLYVVVECQDVTAEVLDSKKRVAQLTSAETFRVLVSSLRDYAIFMLDTNGNIATWNTGAMLLKQYKHDEIVGKHFSTFYSEDDRRARKPEKELEVALREGKVEDEGWRVKKDGSRFWANVIISPVYRDGVLTGFSKVTRDLTERKAGEARLISAYEEASKLKSDFLANMSHEIRTPMHGMLSALSLLIDTGLTEEQKELTDIIDESGAILLQVINDILDYTKLSSGSFSITKEVMNIPEIVAAVRRCFNIGKADGFRFEVDVDPHLPAFAQGDPLRYRQVLQNLVSNAIKFTDKGYIRVKVTVTHEDDSSYEIKTEVIDSGIGVMPDAENVLFTPFTQLDNSSTKRYKGTGLGLSICKSLAELMGGTIGYLKNPERQGSIFFFTSRVNKLEATPAKPLLKSAPDVKLKHLAQTKHLLLVEDNAINQTIMIRLLRSFGFEKVDVAADGAEGLRLVNQKPLAYSLILMDISMPVMDGVTATQKIRAAGHTIPIVAMTANALKGDEEAYLAEGMNDYIAKPVDRKLLTEILLRWMR